MELRCDDYQNKVEGEASRYVHTYHSQKRIYREKGSFMALPGMSIEARIIWELFGGLAFGFLITSLVAKVGLSF